MTAEDRKYTITKNNILIERINELTKPELKLFLLASSQINKNYKKESYFVFKAEIDKHLNNTKISEIKKFMKKLQSRTMTIEDTNTISVINLLSKSTYDKNEKCFEIKFHEDVMPYLYDYQNNFTMYNILNVLSLKSQYSIRIYELLIQYQNISKSDGYISRGFKIDELRKMINIPKSYKFSHFKDMMDYVKTDLKSNSDISMKYELGKTGNKNTDIILSYVATSDITENFKKFIDTARFNDQYQKMVETSVIEKEKENNHLF